MKVMIRSQDRETLLNLDNYILKVVKAGVCYDIICSCLTGDGIHLGTYSTKEDCISILNQIEKIIESNPVDRVGHGYPVYNFFYVFDMPEATSF